LCVMISLAVYVGLLVFSALIIIAGMYIVFRTDTSGKVVKPAAVEEEEPRGNVRRRRTALGGRQQFQEDDNEQQDRDLNIEDIRSRRDTAGNKIGKKKAAKIAAKAQAKRDREALQQMREEKKIKEDKEYEERMRLRAEEEELERKIEEDEKARQEAMEKKKQEEYEEWKNFISVEETGTDLLDENAKEARTNKIIKYIQEKKIIMLEELSAVFKMKTSEIVELLQQLDAQDRLMGVIDDRGKFIYLEESELDQIARFIQRRGRVNVHEIHNECNKIIQLPQAALTEEEMDYDDEQ